MKRLLALIVAALFALPAFGQVQIYTRSPISSDGATSVGASITTPCTTASAILYNASTPCSANLTFNPTGSLLTLGTDVVVSRYAAKQVMISGDGIGLTTNAGLIVGYYGTSNIGGIWPSTTTPNTSNYIVATNGSTLYLNSPTATVPVEISSGSATTLLVGGPAGTGLIVTAGTAATNTPRALSISQTWTDGTSGNIGIVGNFDMGATGTATGKLLSLQSYAAGTTEVFFVTQTGVTEALGEFRGPGITVSGYVLSTTSGAFYSRANTGVGFSFGASDDVNINRLSAGLIGIGTGAAGSVAGGISLTTLIVAQASPAAAGACTAGTITADTGFIYACTATGAWKRVAITGGY